MARDASRSRARFHWLWKKGALPTPPAALTSIAGLYLTNVTPVSFSKFL
jgi:hypothetical protein